MSDRRWNIPVFSILFAIACGVAGWFLAGTTTKHESKPADTAAEAAPALSPQTLANLGVKVEAVEPSNYTRHRSVTAVVAETPTTLRPVPAPLGGRVQEILVEPGRVVRPGEVIARILREPIPRPELVLTEEILKPGKEELHSAVIELRKSREEVRIAETELARIRKYTGRTEGEDLPILPRQTAIDLEYQLSRARKSYQQAEFELRKHGLTDEQIQDVAGGGRIPEIARNTWRLALERNGLWPSFAEELYQALPAETRDLPWAVATIGELAAAGLVNPSLLQFMKEDAEAGKHFLEVGSLLLAGHTIEDLRQLSELCGLCPVMQVRAPVGAEDWDVHDIHVKVGRHISAGEFVISVSDPRRLYLRTEPTGGEQADVLRAAESGTELRAVPLVPGSGPEIEGLSIAYVRSAEKGSGTIAFIETENSPLAGAGGGYRSWQLRVGLRYAVQFPVEVLTNVFVLPSEAVASDGPNRIVFVQDGDTFRRVEVEVIREDDQWVVVAINKHTELFPGDPVAISGAFALSLALKGSAAEADPHAGHNH